MTGKGWSKRGYGCAVSGEICLAVSARYHVAEHRLCVDQAWAGKLSDRAFVSDLAKALGRKPFWVPLSFASESERGDIKICAIDDADGKLRGSQLAQAMVTQMQAVEANKTGDYIRTLTRFTLETKKTHILGASVPRAAVQKTSDQWASYGVLNPCVGSVRAAVANVFLALHPAARAADVVHRLLAYRSEDTDFFCYLQNRAFMDSGGSPCVSGGGYESLLDHLGSWGGEFAKKYQLTRNEHVCAYVLSAESMAAVAEEFSEEALEFWTVPWGTTVTFKSDAVKETVLGHCKQALPALGLALHGV